jgi:hypothetical protein
MSQKKKSFAENVSIVLTKGVKIEKAIKPLHYNDEL